MATIRAGSKSRMTSGGSDEEAASGGSLQFELRSRCFRWLWGKYVTGFNPKHHCRACLLGERLSIFSGVLAAPLNTRFVTALTPARGNHVYLCGGHSRGYGSNLHVALVADRGHVCSIVTSDIRIEIVGWRRVAIPDIDSETRLRLGLTVPFARCRCFRFGAAYFGGTINGTKWAPVALLGDDDVMRSIGLSTVHAHGEVK